MKVDWINLKENPPKKDGSKYWVWIDTFSGGEFRIDWYNEQTAFTYKGITHYALYFEPTNKPE